MPQITISYESQKTLEALQNISKYFDFVIEKPKTIGKKKSIMKKDNILIGNSTIDVSELTKIFSTKNIVASQLRSELWKRN